MHFLSDAAFVRRNSVLLLLLLVPICSIVAQEQKAINTKLQEERKYYTPQLAGSSLTVKPKIVRTVVRDLEEKSPEPKDNVNRSNSSLQITRTQLMAKVSASQMTSDVTIYTGALDQCAPQVVTNGSVMYVAFESYDTQSGTFPYGSIQIYQSTNGGSSWSSWNYVNSSSYQLYSPQIVLIGGAVVVSYIRNGALRTMRLDLTGVNPFVPLPTPSVDEYVVAYRMVSDVEQYPSSPWLYVASLFKRADGKNRVFYSCSQDTGRTWGVYDGSGTFYVNYYDSLGLSQTELGKASIGFDYGRSGLYLAYLGTGTNAGNICMLKSTNLGKTWGTESILPSEGLNLKVGPMVAAMGQRVAVVYQYDYNGTATDWKTSGPAGDFDIDAVVSYDGGTNWYTRSVGGTINNEILPWVTHDADSSFYVSFIRDGKTRVSSAGDEIAFSAADSSSSNTSNLDNFPSIFGSTISGEKKAYTTWTGISDGLDIFGAVVALRVPPLSPSNLVATVVSSSQIKITWNDNSTDETGFSIYSRAGGTAGTWSKLTTAPANITSNASYIATGLIPSTQYEFFVCAINANGNSLRTNIESATTAAAAPATPTLTYPLDGATGIVATDSVRWTPVAGATSYHVQIGSSSDMLAGYFVNDTVTSNVHWIGPSNFNQQLYWHVRALNATAASPFSAIWGFIRNSGSGASLSATPLSLDFGYVQVSSTSIEKTYSISGSNLTSTGSISITAPARFEISQTSGSGFSSSLSIPYSGTSLSATSIFVRFVPASAISYSANIIHSGGGIASYQVSVSGIGNVAPGIPIGINAAAGNGQVMLKWNRNTESDFLRYRIYRNTLPVSPIKVDSTAGGILDTVRIMSGLSNGTIYYFSVTAVDSGGLESAHSSEVTATPSVGNTAPAAPQNLTAAIGNGQVTLKWNKNTESDFLRYRIFSGISPNPTIKIDSASGGITDTVRVISGLANSTLYYFRITAVDNAYLESGFSNEVNATPSAVVDNTPPSFTVSPYVTGTPVVVSANGQVSSSPQVNASASDAGSGISRMQVVYRNTLEQNWSTSAPVSASSISFSIPTNKFVSNNKPIGVNYRVGAWDNAGNVAWSPYNSIDVQLGPQVTDQPTSSMPAASQLSNKTTAYRIISVPYNLSSTNQQPDKFLSNLGPHAENNISYARWRFQRWFNGQYQDYDQFSSESVVIPGAAFFFIVRDQGLQIAVQGASVVRSDSMFAQGIQLQSGWNLVGDPFTFPYPIDSLIFSAGSIRQRAYYTGSGSIGGWDTSSASVQFIQPWQGVALFVNNAGTLRFPSLGMRGLPKMSVASIPVLERKTSGNWTLALNAYRSDINMRCEGSSLGMAQGANEGDDPYDSYIPPIVGEKNVAVYFKNADGAMMRDIRPPNEDGDVWEMRIITGDAGARVTLQIGDKLNLPNPAFEAYLIDIDQKMAYNLKEIQSLEINSGNGIRNFRVVIGKKSFVTQNNAGVALAPSRMKLYANYPNPFNPETVIRYAIPDASSSYAVTLKIFNVLGQEITTLVNEQKSSGYYEVKWNALQQSSGIYFYQLSITDGSKTFREIKKMVLMK